MMYLYKKMLFFNLLNHLNLIMLINNIMLIFLMDDILSINLNFTLKSI